MNVADMTLDDLRAFIAEVVDDRLEALGFDPDEGLEFREDFLAEIQHRLAHEEPTLTTEDVRAALDARGTVEQGLADIDAGRTVSNQDVRRRFGPPVCTPTAWEGAPVNVAEMTLDELRAFIAEVVDDRLEELGFDPDEGLEFQEEFAESIVRQLAERGPTYSLDEVRAERGL